MNSPARLLLVRHAAIECTNNGTPALCGSHDARLSPLGISQVELLRSRLACEPGIAALYSSPLRRAVETAAAAPVNLIERLRLAKSLAEIHCGSIEGMSLSVIQRTYPELWRKNETQDDEGFRWPGGETYRRFPRRILRAIRCISRIHAGQKVLIVTHAGVVNQILGTIAGQNAARWENYRPGNTAVTEVLWRGDLGTLVRFDDRSHLSSSRSRPLFV